VISGQTNAYEEQDNSMNEVNMERAVFDDYISRFNARDMTAFEKYIHPDARVINGTLEINGIQGMKDHYAKIWKSFSEELHVERFVSDANTLAIQMWAHFRATTDDDESLFGRVRAGECFDYRGIIMYQNENDKFTDIKVAYMTFTRTTLDGETIDLGIPH
jgi:ketosteroid isomerase-like protein